VAPKRRPPPRPPKPRPPARQTASSLSALARLVGKTPKTLSLWSRDARWPFGRSGPYDVAAVRAWAARTLAPNPAAPDPQESPSSPPSSSDSSPDGLDAIDGRRDVARATQIAKLRVLVERSANLKVDRLIKEREYVPRAEYQTRQDQRESAIVVSLMQLPERLAPALANKPAEELRRILDHALRNLLNLAFGHDSAPGIPPGAAAPDHPPHRPPG
jgi:hypothetical protein